MRSASAATLPAPATSASRRKARSSRAASSRSGSSPGRSEEHTSELQSLMRSSYAVLCLKKKHNKQTTTTSPHTPTKNTHDVIIPDKDVNNVNQYNMENIQ